MQQRQLRAAVQVRVLCTPGGGGCRGGGGRGLHAVAAHAGAEDLTRSLPSSLTVGAAGVAPQEAHEAATDVGALHVVDSVLGAGAVRERHGGASAAWRRGDGVDLSGA